MDRVFENWLDDCYWGRLPAFLRVAAGTTAKTQVRNKSPKETVPIKEDYPVEFFVPSSRVVEPPQKEV